MKVQNTYCGAHCQEVHTREEAQVFVHDANLSATVQLNEETPAVLSLGKLCEDHGYSDEWISGQKPRLTKEGKTIFCRTDNFVLLVVPGLSTNFWKRFVLYIATAGVIKFILRSSIEAK